ncbi:tRNA (5-methylaminomethyl-2-thiouridine)(34)-methyltransferase MnmD [Pedobacter metabolipauper]|uniref:tRNA U34 5-methylaminomethyl-2-thiouridine-forming methyltransferase MnmC n=1 Tax=Pedobacter metabolipauper TaxID=425513 RepID=A0A4R6SRB1_9SPHI|nr:tRNA (5-methylaminomethyl-2-thiouridine)(34)-methyltransferase MnmD [Pedobacter metabolipauper]TDQ06910.1 tRNA U34 5-methylaminomethyl-2-thiouridine-forming methyltransferase MnmC [Pedobacter metabolipauper]
MNIITTTADGSNTLYNEQIGEHYHSKHGALQESKHVFVDAGLKHVIAQSANSEVSVLEIGFGTGLNFLLTAAHCAEQNTRLLYTALEAFPLTLEELQSTGYSNYVPQTLWDSLIENYGKTLQQSVELVAGQQLRILHTYLHRFQTDQRFDLVYFDAFSVQHQPEMWTDEIIAHTCQFIKPGGTFVTYAITGKLKRALKSIGFTIEKLPGAPGKREMLRATKNTAEYLSADINTES